MQRGASVLRSVGLRYSGYTNVTFTGDVPAEGNRADEVDADKIATESASEDFRYLLTAHGDFGRRHPAIIQHERAWPTALSEARNADVRSLLGSARLAG